MVAAEAPMGQKQLEKLKFLTPEVRPTGFTDRFLVAVVVVWFGSGYTRSKGVSDWIAPCMLGHPGGLLGEKGGGKNTVVTLPCPAVGTNLWQEAGAQVYLLVVHFSWSILPLLVLVNLRLPSRFRAPLVPVRGVYPAGRLSAQTARAAKAAVGTPAYVYDAASLRSNAEACLAFPNAYGLTVRYAMKSLPNKAVLQLFHG